MDTAPKKQLGFTLKELAKMLQHELNEEESELFLEELLWFINNENEDLRLFFIDKINHFNGAASVRLQRAREKEEEEAIQEAFLEWEVNMGYSTPNSSTYLFGAPSKDWIEKRVTEIIEEGAREKAAQSWLSFKTSAIENRRSAL